MLSTATISDAATSSSSVRVKNLDATLTRDEQKDLEPDFELEEPANNEKREDSVAEIHDGDQEEAASSTPFSLSSRALAVQSYLRDTTSVKAIVLRQDGSAEEVSYDGSSSSTRRLLGGRPSVVGEIEALKLLVVQPLSEDSSVGAAAANSHTLPVPLCHHRAHGDYVLFRVDSEGKAGDVSLSEYQKYVEDHKTLTETALKNYSAESEQIRCSSPRALYQSTKLLRGAVEAQIFGESETVDLSDAEIQNAVKEGLQKLVDEAVAESTASPMEDPDYSPEDDAEEQQDEEQGAEGIVHAFDSSVDDRPWRSQLEDAMKHIQEIGKLDGAVFAQMISATFYELNGTEPALDQLATLFAKIREEFANEAAEEMDDESGAESETESESEVDEEWQETLDHVRSTAKRDGRVLVNNICDAFYDDNGEELTLEELTEIWQGIQDELALEAQEEADSEDEHQSDSEETGYDPENEDDAALAQRDAAEDREHDLHHFDGVLLNTPMVTAKNGGGVSWNVFFDEKDLSEAAESSNLERAKEGFLKRNGREATHFEVQKMKQFLTVPNELVEAEESTAALSPSSVEVSSSGAISWTIFFGESRGSLEGAVAAFDRIYGRKPVPFEVQQIRAFLAPHSERMESTKTKSMTSSKVLVSPVAEKKTAKRFNVYLEDSKLSQKETEDVAIKWFGRFNKREPNESDLSQIRAFIQKDSDLTEQSFLVQGSALDFDDDDAKETELPAKSTTKGVVSKESATGYTLNFEDDEQGDDGDAEEAIKWFKRFNNREPDEAETLQIKQFMKADDEEMINIE